jgi:uncharacterized protein (TIGR04255 family)
MALPNYPREIYQKNPLAEVVCQVRFAASSGMPRKQLNAFWDRIRDRFPRMEEAEGVEAPNVTDELPQEVIDYLSLHEFYDFISEDGLWTLSLTADSLALTCRSYERWEEFKIWMALALDALERTYQPQTFLRLGLRYLDVVQRSQLGLDGVAWPELLAGPLVGELASPDIGSDIEDVTHEFVFRLNDAYESRVRVRHGFVQTEDDTGEICYLVDSDFYTDEKVERSNADKILDEYNRYARRFFRWCISEQLHTAMDPVRI